MKMSRRDYCEQRNCDIKYYLDNQNIPNIHYSGDPVSLYVGYFWAKRFVSEKNIFFSRFRFTNYREFKVQLIPVHHGGQFHDLNIHYMIIVGVFVCFIAINDDPYICYTFLVKPLTAG